MNIWVLTGLRSGSTYFCNLLWDTGAFTYPLTYSDLPSVLEQRKSFEYLAPNHESDTWDIYQIIKTRELAIQQLKSRTKFFGLGPNLLKVPMEHFEYHLLDYNDRPLIEELYPESKFIWLEREDIFARTVSAYFFFTSKVSHLYGYDEKKKYLAKRIPFDANGILDVYFNHIKKADWGPFLEGVDYLKISYEDLVKYPELVLKHTMDWLGIEGRDKLDYKTIVENRIKIKTERPETQKYINALKKLLIGMV